MGKRSNWSAEVDAINNRSLRDQGIIDVDGGVTPTRGLKPSANAQSELDQVWNQAASGITQVGDVVSAMGAALRGEVALDGPDSGWSQIGGIQMGKTSIVKSLLGEPIFEITIKALNTDDNSIHPVLVKRTGDVVERVSIDFMKTLAFANLSEKQFTPDETNALLAQMMQVGFVKPK